MKGQKPFPKSLIKSSPDVMIKEGEKKRNIQANGTKGITKSSTNAALYPPICSADSMVRMVWGVEDGKL